MSVHVRTAREDDREPLHRIGMQAFASRPAVFDPDADRARTPLGRRLVADVDGALAGKLSVWELGQWFGERRVPMGGVAGVAVLPEFRGRGVASKLLAAAISEMRDRGDLISSLFPMNHTLYRRAGWQSAGRYPVHDIPARALQDLPPPSRPVDIRPATIADVPQLREVHEAMSRREQGNLWFGPEFAVQRLGPRADGASDAYVTMIGGDISGFIAIEKKEPRDDAEFYSLDVECMAAADRDTDLALWRLVSAYHPLARSVRFVVPPERTLLHFLGEREMRPASTNFVWMTRLIDAASAISARGYSAQTEAEVHVEIIDELAPWNAGKFVLRTDGDKASLEPGGMGNTEIGIGELSSMYTGWCSPYHLAEWGGLRGASKRDLAALARIFSGPTPYMRDFF